MLLKKNLYKTGTWFSVVAMAASLAACGGSDSEPDPLQAYRAQALQWAPCDGTITSEPDEDTAELWGRLGNRLQCSTMRAPMDWAKPGRSDVFVGVMRLAAADPAQHRGALLFNPGGPGVDGLDQSLRLLLAFGESNPESTQGALQLRLLASYDMVGFSPRGTGASTRLSCGTNELERFVDPSPTQLTDANLANAAYNDRKTAEACLKNPLTPHIHTDATARDMDLLRGLLGEEKLNYVGYSYGTWLGAWYASLFPEKVGRMVFDSSMDFTGSHEKGTIAMVTARQRTHEEVLLTYATRHNDYFHVGASTAEIRAMLLTLSPQMQAVLGDAVGVLTYSRSSADKYVATLNAARGLDGVLKALPNAADEKAVQAALSQHVFIPGNQPLDQAVREQAEGLYENYHSVFVSPNNGSIQLDDATYWAVSCNDTPATTDPDAWNATVRSSARMAPLFFDATLRNICANWGGPRVIKPGVATMQGLDILMVQSQYDTATPMEGANRFFAQLTSARRVYVPGEFQHAVFPYTDTCVDTTVVRYLLGETPTERETVCQAHPLKQDVPAVKVRAKSAARSMDVPRLSTGSSSEPSTYLNSEAAQELIERFKEGIGRRR